MIPESKDSVSGRERGRLVKGWRSNHLGNGGAVGWCTAQVFLGISRFKRLVKALITDSVLSEFDGRKATAPVDIKGSVASSKEWERLLDTDLELSGNFAANALLEC